MTERGKVISFRVGEEDLPDLERRAETAGQTVHEVAKRALRKSFENQTNEMAISLSAIQEELTDLRQDIAVSVEALLLLSGKVGPADALKFVRDNLKKRI
jgi:hypothetical protein